MSQGLELFSTAPQPSQGGPGQLEPFAFATQKLL